MYKFSDSERLMDVDEAKVILGLSATQVGRLIREGHLRAQFKGGSWIVFPYDLEAYAANRIKGSKTEK